MPVYHYRCSCDSSHGVDRVEAVGVESVTLSCEVCGNECLFTRYLPGERTPDMVSVVSTDNFTLQKSKGLIDSDQVERRRQDQHRRTREFHESEAGRAQRAASYKRMKNKSPDTYIPREMFRIDEQRYHMVEKKDE